MTKPAVRKNKWFLRQPSGAAVARLFCIPYSGCGASMYRKWPEMVNGVEFCPLQPPGRESRLREPAFDSYEAMADELVDALEPYLDRPYCFFGHCGSALAAYAACVRLARTDLPQPTALFVSSQVAPQDGPAGRFLQLDDGGLAEELRKLIVEMGGTPTPDVIDLSLDVLRTDIEANKRYVVPDPVRLSTPITAIGWTDDVEVEYGKMGGWSSCGPTTFEVLEGRHHRFVEGPPDLIDLFVAGLRR